MRATGEADLAQDLDRIGPGHGVPDLIGQVVRTIGINLRLFEPARATQLVGQVRVADGATGAVVHALERRDRLAVAGDGRIHLAAVTLDEPEVDERSADPLDAADPPCELEVATE